jgi:hypothetical protein
MNEIDFGPLQYQLVEHESLRPGRILHLTARRQRTLAHVQVVGRERRTQVVQHQLLELESALQPEVRLGEEVCVAIELQRTLVENAGVEMELGGILVLSRQNVANVLGDAVDVRHYQGPRVVRLDVGTGTISNPHLVHLQG